MKICQLDKKGKQLLNDESDEIDIGIGRLSPSQRSQSEADPNDFRVLRKLFKRKSSPLRRLLQDVDYCMISYMEVIQETAAAQKAAALAAAEHSDSNGPMSGQEQPRSLKTEIPANKVEQVDPDEKLANQAKLASA